MMSRNRIYTSSKFKQPFTKMHTCSNLNQLLPQNCYRCCLIHWSTSIEPEISFTVLYTPWNTGEKHARCMYGGGDSAGLVIERSRVRISAVAAGKVSSPGSTFCADSYFGIRSTPVLLQSFRQKCRWQVTAKHTYT